MTIEQFRGVISMMTTFEKAIEKGQRQRVRFRPEKLLVPIKSEAKLTLTFTRLTWPKR